MSATAKLAVLLAGLTLSMATYSPAEASAPGCVPAGSKTVKETRTVRIVRKDGLTYGCHLASGRRTYLGDEPDDTGFFFITTLRISGDYVGYNLAASSNEGTVASIVVRNLRTGRTVRATPARGLPQLDGDSVKVSDLELKPNGSVAWVFRIVKLAPPFPVSYEVRRLQGSARSSSTLLDSGPGIGPRSLTLRRSRLAWLNGGQPRAARLR